jgi:hypothetical protein
MGFIAPVGAQEKGPNDWKYGIAIYLWGTGIEGTSQIGPVTAPVNITFSDALDNLSSALMLHFEAQKNWWGFMADLMHIGLDPEATLPSGASLTLDTTNNIVELAGIYQAAENFQLLFGMRFTDFELEGKVPGVASRNIADESWTDGFIGGRLLVPFGGSENWRLRARGDIGAGDSNLVWNAVLGIDYRFSNRVAGLLGYRWLDYDYDYDNGKTGADRFSYDVTYEGPAVALAFTW